MRTVLVPYENRRLIYRGFVETWTERDQCLDVLIRQVTCRGFDPSLPGREILAQEPAKLDHIWLRFPDDARQRPKLERMMRIHGCGICKWYRRTNGSVDLGLVNQGIFRATSARRDLQQALDRGLWGTILSITDTLLDDVQLGYIFLVLNTSHDAILDQIHRYRALAQANWDALIPTVLSQPAERSKAPLIPSRRKRPPALGF